MSRSRASAKSYWPYSIIADICGRLRTNLRGILAHPSKFTPIRPPEGPRMNAINPRAARSRYRVSTTFRWWALVARVLGNTDNRAEVVHRKRGANLIFCLYRCFFFFYQIVRIAATTFYVRYTKKKTNKITRIIQKSTLLEPTGKSVCPSLKICLSDLQST